MSTSRRGPYAKTAAKQAAILDAARDSFLESGYEAATVRDVARRVGMSHAGVLHHFGSKEELLLGLLARRDAEEARQAGIPVDPANDSADVARDSSPDDALSRDGVPSPATAPSSGCTPAGGLARRGGLLGLLREHQRTPEFMRWWGELAAAAARPDHPAHGYFAQRFARRRQIYAERLATGRMGGQLDPRIDAETAAALYAAVLDGLQAQWLYDPTLDIQSTVKKFASLITKRNTDGGR